jgi:hypothetical protein
LFLVEWYLPHGAERTALADAERAREASQALALQGTLVRYLGSTLVPSDETCFVMFEAGSAEAVRCLLDQAAMPCDRIVEALRIGPGSL